jgi:hypothetical protein
MKKNVVLRIVGTGGTDTGERAKELRETLTQQKAYIVDRVPASMVEQT